MLCPALALGISGTARAGSETEQKTGTVTIQYMDFASSGKENKPIQGAMFSFYRIDSKKGKPRPTPYVTAKTDAEGVLTAQLPEGVYKVSQTKNGVRYRTSDFLVTIPMKNEAGVLTDAVEAIPKAEPLTPWSDEPDSKSPVPSKKVTATPTPGRPTTVTETKNGNSPGIVKTKKVKTGDDGIYPAAVAAVVSAAGLGTVMLIGWRKQRKGDEKR